MGKLQYLLVSLSLLCASIATAQSQTADISTNYPSKPVTIIVGFAPGGSVDISARFFAKRLTESLGQSFIVQNRPGAGGTIATNVVAKAAPDGYTLIMLSAMTHAVNATLYRDLPYDSVKDFAPISTVTSTPVVIAVHPSVPANTLRELIDLVKTNPGKFDYASGGSGTSMHLGMELFLSMADIKMMHVPYNGMNPATMAVLGGQIPVLTGSLSVSQAHARAGKLRILAVTTAKRTPLAPEIPTVTEAGGLPGYEAVVRVGLLAPHGTPPAIINKLNSAIGHLVQLPDVRAQLASLGNDPDYQSPAAFGELIKLEIGKWGKIIRQTGAKVD